MSLKCLKPANRLTPSNPCKKVKCVWPGRMMIIHHSCRKLPASTNPLFHHSTVLLFPHTNKRSLCFQQIADLGQKCLFFAWSRWWRRSSLFLSFGSVDRFHQHKNGKGDDDKIKSYLD